MTTTPTTPTTPTSKLNIQSSIPEIQRIVRKRSAAEAAARGSPRVSKANANATTSAKTTVVTNMYDLLQSEALTTISPAVKKKQLTRPAVSTANADPNAKLKAKAKDTTTATMKRRGPGRLVFGDYEPPTTQHYQQNLASYMGNRSVELEDELSIQRFASGASSAMGSQEEMKRVEKDAMTRMARLAAEKRHDKINKRTKAGH